MPRRVKPIPGPPAPVPAPVPAPSPDRPPTASAMPSTRIGHGYDLHRLDAAAPAGAGRPLRLGGVEIPSDRGPVSHSDGDALLHAITDAILGALGEPDIGTLFPDSAPENAGRDS